MKIEIRADWMSIQSPAKYVKFNLCAADLSLIDFTKKLIICV